MMDFINYSSFPGICFQSMDQQDTEFHIVAAKVTYDIHIGEENNISHLDFALKQASLHYADVYYEPPYNKSVEYECDLAPYKPKTDVVINATAFSPCGKAVPYFNVAIRVAGLFKSLRINGPRHWEFTLAGWSLKPPQPITSLAIRYEHASGGKYEIEGKAISSETNPSGIGWYPNEYLKQCKMTTLPAAQIEESNSLIENIQQIVTPEGFGFFGRSWRGRIEHAGTYDETWKKERHPYLPEDFEFNYWCGSHPSLQMTHPKPGEKIPVNLFGLLPASELLNQKIYFYIPVETLFVFFSSTSGISATKDMILDTIVIDMHKRKVFSTYRMVFKKELGISEVQLRHIAVDNRQQQRDQAAFMLKDNSSSTFIPVPPGLFSHGVNSDG